MKKIVYIVALMALFCSVNSFADEWVKFKVKAVQILNGNIAYNVDRDDGTVLNKFLSYAGSKSDDVTTVNRLYATALTAISAGNVLEAYTDGVLIWNNSTYVVTGIRVTSSGTTN